MLNLKRMVCMLLTAGMFTTALPVQALAASDYQYITNISLKVEVDLDAGDEVNSGDSVGTSKDDSGTKVYTTSDKYSVESAEWTNNKDVSIGDTPKITVWLEPDSSSSSKYEYRFRSSYGSSKVSISGGEFVSCSKSGSSLKVVLRVNGVKGTYEAPKEAEWGSGKGKATWKAPDDKTGYYDVILYKGSTVMKKLEDYNGTSYNFYPYMTKEGDYTFKVRTVPHTDEQKRYGKKSEWTESDSKYIDEDDVSDGSGQDNSSNGSNSGGITPGGGTTDAGWKQDNNDWYFKYPDGNYVKNNWLQWNNKWYLFDNSGKMLKGWQQKDNHWYYFDANGNPVKNQWMQDGNNRYWMQEDGEMSKQKWVYTEGQWYWVNAQGAQASNIWVEDGGSWYYMGGDGRMMTNTWLDYAGKWYYLTETGAAARGWKELGGKWYFFNDSDCSMAKDTMVGQYRVDVNGVYIP